MNKTVATLFLSSFVCLSSMAATSYEQAKTVVKDYVENTLGLGNYYLYGNDSSLSEVEISYDEPVKVDPSGWTFFVDMMPYAMWGHSAKVVSVSKENGTMVVNDVTMPLENMEGWSDYSPVQTTLRSAPAYGLNTIDNIKYDSNGFLSNGQFKKSGKSSPNSYAVLYCGGASVSQNYIAFWNDCAMVYQLLTDVYGIPKSNIYVLMAGGPKETKNVILAKQNTYRDMRLDLDGDGINEVAYSSLPADVTKVFDILKSKSASKQFESLFVYVATHGICDGRIASWNKNPITPSMLGSEIDKVKAKSVSIVLDHCYSGSFIPTLSKFGLASNRTIVASVNPNEPGIVQRGDNGYYANSYFAKPFMCGLADPEDADYDGDGEVSLLEAFRFTKDNNPASSVGLSSDFSNEVRWEHPQYWSSDCYGEKQLVSGMIQEKIVYNSKVSNAYLVKMAANTVESSSAITDYADVTFQSYNKITLRPPFSVKNGASFHGRILPCKNSNVTTANDGTACKKSSETVGSTKVKDVESSSLSIFPNPTSGAVTIRLGDKIIDRVEVVDALGKTVLSADYNDNEVSIDLTEFGTGMYFVKVTSEDDIVVEKVVLK